MERDWSASAYVPFIEALRAHGIIQPSICGPEEALAVVNGTGPRCAVALALHDVNVLLPSQVLAALAVETLTGTPQVL
ncbi:hypothetical protein JB92DRAFT_3141858 [Gautieria morchelliformis]|nr:hypothetical protein JB92DRAFT_3141858 [Gautieria morchelliformis]